MFSSKQGTRLQSTLSEGQMQLPNLWQWEGRITRKTYFIVGVAAFAVKFFLDWLAVTRLFHRPWSLLNYWRPFGLIHNIGNITSPERGMAFVLLTLALPFLWIGLSMTVRRLRDVGQPVWLVVLFFVPLVNLFFFAGLSLLPSAKELRKEDAAPWPGPSILDAWIPRTPAGSALLAIALTATMGLLFTLLGASVLRDYGFGLFVALPFSLGLFSVLTHSYREPRSFGSCMKVALLPIGILGAVLLVVALEGLICILMAAPLALALAALGGALGYAVQAAHWGRKQTAAMLSVAFLLPLRSSAWSTSSGPSPQPSSSDPSWKSTPRRKNSGTKSSLSRKFPRRGRRYSAPASPIRFARKSMDAARVPFAIAFSPRVRLSSRFRFGTSRIFFASA